MPKLMDQEDLKSFSAGTFGFSAVDPGELKETEYTLVVWAFDLSGSTSGFRTAMFGALGACLKKMQGDAAAGIRPHPDANRIMVAVVVFGTRVEQTIAMAPLMSLDISTMQAAIESASVGITTANADAIVFSGECIKNYAKQLAEQDIECNGLFFDMTDGWNNAGRFPGSFQNGQPRPDQATYDKTIEACKTALGEPVQDEALESLCTILIGVNLRDARPDLERFHADIGFTEPMVELEGADDPAAWDKVADFFYNSVSSSSTARGTGTKSTSIANAI